MGDRSSRPKWNHFPSLAASRRAVRATAPQLATPTETKSRTILRSPCVGLAGFEPATSASQTPRAAKLRHSPFTEGYSDVADQ